MEVGDIRNRTETQSGSPAPEPPAVPAPPVVPAPPAEFVAEYEHCDQCGAPVDHAQRYCVVCGTRRRHVRDPAARYMSTVAGRSRASTAAGRSTNKQWSPGLGTALVLAIIPLAVGLGLLVGRSSNNGDAKLIAALRSQKTEVITTTGSAAAGTTASSSAAASTLTSTFPLPSGYAVELQTLPQGTTAAAVASAEQAARSSGATGVGLILQSDFTVTPAPPAGAYIIYSGAYSASAAADKALAKLRSHFSGARVVHVVSVGSGTGGSGKVLAHTAYGTVHQIAGFKPTQAQLNQGGQIAARVQSEIGQNYRKSQQGLPDQISVP